MISNNNTLRVSGLASGMNTDEIVTNLVKAQSARLNKMTQTKTLTTWKSDAYRGINTKVAEFRKAMEGLRLQSTFNKQAVTTSDPRVEVSSAGVSSQTDFVISQASPATVAKPAIVSFNSQMASGTSSIGADQTFKLNGVDIALTASMTFDQAISKINEFSATTNVKAANVGGSLVLTSTNSGLSSAINLELLTGTNSLNMANKVATGADASVGSVTINGTSIALASNKFTYDGVSFTIKESIPGGSNISVQVGSDTKGIFDSVKTFVDKYNELIADFNGRLTEKRYRDYAPLSDEQKKDMKENDIKLWDEKAKSGLLTNDPTIRSFLTEMRNSFTAIVPGVSANINSLKDIGINFSTFYKDNGKLILDEVKLNGVLKTNLEDLKKLFTVKGTGATSTSTTVTDKNMHDNSGYAFRIYDRLNATVAKLGTLAGSPNSSVDTESYIAKQIKFLDANIGKEQQKISVYEQRLWKQFGAMEKALQQYNSQGAWLSQQLGM
jgi:flagellar hook-associated protein 2